MKSTDCPHRPGVPARMCSGCRREQLGVERLVVPTPMQAHQAFSDWESSLPGCEKSYYRHLDYQRGWSAAITWMMETMASDKSG